jgi:DNA-binding HxlR family transcriptional regulator
LFFETNRIREYFAWWAGEDPSGLRAKDLRAAIQGLTAAQASYLLKRLRTHHLIKKVGRRYKYFLTKLGRALIATALILRENLLIPELQQQLAA